MDSLNGRGRAARPADNIQQPALRVLAPKNRKNHPKATRVCFGCIVVAKKRARDLFRGGQLGETQNTAGTTSKSCIDT